MNEIDIGPVRVALTAIPDEANGSSSRPSLDAESVRDEGDSRLDGFPKLSALSGGLTLFEATVIRSPIRMTVAAYSDPKSSRSLILAQTPLSSLEAGDDGKATVLAPGKDLEETDVNGEKAARVVISDDPSSRSSRSSFVWVSGGSVYQLTGRGSSDADLTEIAASI